MKKLLILSVLVGGFTLAAIASFTAIEKKNQSKKMDCSAEMKKNCPRGSHGCCMLP